MFAQSSVMSACKTQYSGSTIPSWCRADPLDGVPDWCRDEVRSLAAETSSVISSLKERNNKTVKGNADSAGKTAVTAVTPASSIITGRSSHIGPIIEEEEDSSDDMPLLEGMSVSEQSTRHKKQGMTRLLFKIA